MIQAYGLHGGPGSRTLGRKLLGETKAMAIAPYDSHMVRIDHLPERYKINGVDDERYIHKLGEVHDYYPDTQEFRISLPGLQEAAWPTLKAGEDFHKVDALTGQVVEVNRG